MSSVLRFFRLTDSGAGSSSISISILVAALEAQRGLIANSVVISSTILVIRSFFFRMLWKDVNDSKFHLHLREL